MDPHQLFTRVKALWPDAILLSTDAGWEESQPIWSVVHVHDVIKKQVETDDWLSIAAWSFHQALTVVARSRLAAGQTTLRPADVTFESFDRQMRKNLADETWADSRSDYGSSNS